MSSWQFWGDITAETILTNARVVTADEDPLTVKRQSMSATSWGSYLNCHLDLH